MLAQGHLLHRGGDILFTPVPGEIGDLIGDLIHLAGNRQRDLASETRPLFDELGDAGCVVCAHRRDGFIAHRGDLLPGLEIIRGVGLERLHPRAIFRRGRQLEHCIGNLDQPAGTFDERIARLLQFA